MELRKTSRFPVQCPTSISSDEPIGDGEGALKNVSIGGCAVGSNLGLAKGTYLGLCFRLPGHQQPVEVVLAKVRWSLGEAAGVEFILMGSDSQERLREYTKSTKPGLRH